MIPVLFFKLKYILLIYRPIVKNVRNAEIMESGNAGKDIRKCGMRDMKCRNTGAEGRGFKLCVAPSLRNQLSLISEVADKSRKMGMRYEEAETRYGLWVMSI
jgi:hypothetical protein